MRITNTNQTDEGGLSSPFYTLGWLESLLKVRGLFVVADLQEESVVRDISNILNCRVHLKGAKGGQLSNLGSPEGRIRVICRRMKLQFVPMLNGLYISDGNLHAFNPLMKVWGDGGLVVGTWPSPKEGSALGT